MSLQYTFAGDIEQIKDTYRGLPIFRKYVDPNRSKNEIEISKKLLQFPCPHCVRIYEIHEEKNNTYIDMELLDTTKSITSEKEKEKIYTDVRLALEELHLQDVIYIDLKQDNVGFSEKEQVWKLFDFDASGISDTSFTKWIEKPPYYYAYKQTLKIYYQLDEPILSIPVEKYSTPNLLLFDEIMYDEFLQELNPSTKE